MDRLLRDRGLAVLQQVPGVITVMQQLKKDDLSD